MDTSARGELVEPPVLRQAQDERLKEPYTPHLPPGWWLHNSRYFLYILRELTAVFAALWVVAFLTQLPQMAGGPEAHRMWLNSIRSPGWILFSLVSLLFVLYHAWTLFTSTGTVVRLKLGKEAVPGRSLNAMMFIGWAGATLVVAFVLASPGIGG